MTDILIGEVMTGRLTLPLYATKRVFDRTIRTDPGYSGLSDQNDRCQSLVRSVEQAMQNDQIEFSHTTDDGSWTGRPQHIERECLSLGIDAQSDRICVHDRSRRITPQDPAFAAIAAEALKALESRGQRREA